MTALLALVMLAAACGNDDSGGDEAGGGGSGSGGDPLDVGVLVSLSGPLATIGEDQVAGMELARDELNEDGDILGREVELIVKDDEADPTKASQGMRELVDREGVQLVYGPTVSSSVLAALAVSTPAEVVEFHSGAADELSDTGEYPYAFRTTSSTETQAATFVDLAEQLGVTKVGVLAVNQAFGTSGVEAIESAVDGTDIELVGTEFFEIGAVDVTTQVERVKDAGAELVVLWASGVGEHSATVKARNQLDWDVPIAGLATMANPLVTEGAGGAGEMTDVYAGQLPSAFTQPLSEDMTAWLDRVREKLGQDPLTRDVQQIAAGYDALMLMAAAIEDAGEVDAGAIRDYLESGGSTGVNGTYAYDADLHEGMSPDSLTFVEAPSFSDGTYVPAEIG